MNPFETGSPPWRVRWEVVLGAGLALALAAMFLWTGSGDGSRVLCATLASGILAGFGWWLGRGRGGSLTYSDVVIGGGIAGVFGSLMAGHGHQTAAWLSSPWVAWALLAVVAALLFFLADTRRSPWLGGAGLMLAWVGVTLQQFTVFSLAASALLVAVAVQLFHRRGWLMPVWLMLAAIHAGFLAGWPFSEGRIDPDRYLALNEYAWTLVFFTAAWAVFTHLALRSADEAFLPSRRLLFVSLNNALFFGVGVISVPPRHPEWFWMFTLAAGLLFLAAAFFPGRFPPLRRAYVVQGATLAALGLVSAIIGRQPAAMLAVASVFFVFTCEDRRHGLLRFCAFLTAAMAFAIAWDPVYRSETPSLWLGVFTGAPLVLSSIHISRHRALWRRGSVVFFGALGLGLWLLTTLAQVPAQYHPPVLAIEAVLVTGTFYLLAIAEFPWLATSVILLAQFLWFRQVDSFTSRPWWNPVIVVLCTLGLSHWWQSRGRPLFSPRVRPWLQGVAAAAGVAITILSVESGYGTTGGGLILLSVLAVALPFYAMIVGDELLVGFGQFLMVTAIGEFIGQLAHSPVPRAIAALAPLVALVVLAPGVARFFRNTIWERPARWLALLYRAIAAVMFVVWTLHYVAPANRFILLALAAVLLVLGCAERRAGALLLGSLICVAGAVLVFWLGWLGAHGWSVREFLGFVLLLAFGRILRGKQLLPDEVQTIGILIGLAALTHWVWLGAHRYAPTVPLTVVWAIVGSLIVWVGWRLQERFYLVFGWGLLVAALGRVLWVNLIQSQMPIGTDPDFRLGLLAVGLATLVAALAYARRPVTSAASTGNPTTA